MNGFNKKTNPSILNRKERFFLYIYYIDILHKSVRFNLLHPVHLLLKRILDTHDYF